MIKFRVFGIPKPGGSKRSFIPGLKAGMEFDPSRHRPIITEDCQKNKEWRDSVIAAAVPFAPGELLQGPLAVWALFLMPRPKSHFRSGKNAGQLRDDAPHFHTKKADLTKLWRSTEDALTQIIWRDDASISLQTCAKIYVCERPGAIIWVTDAENALTPVEFSRRLKIR